MVGCLLFCMGLFFKFCTLGVVKDLELIYKKWRLAS